jgi:hypothetical protein
VALIFTSAAKADYEAYYPTAEAVPLPAKSGIFDLIFAREIGK